VLCRKGNPLPVVTTAAIVLPNCREQVATRQQTFGEAERRAEAPWTYTGRVETHFDSTLIPQQNATNDNQRQTVAYREPTKKAP